MDANSQKIPMSTPTQPETLTLEETRRLLQIIVQHENSVPEHYQQPLNSEEVQVLVSALHHLEAGRQACTCEAFQTSRKFLSKHGVHYQSAWELSDEGDLLLNAELPPVAFCPWCGGTVAHLGNL